MSELVLREDADGVATLTLNRPEALNAMSPSMFVELRAHLDAIGSETETVGCVVLQGAGKSFSAGNDIKAILSGDRAPTPHFQAETIDALEALPQPVIASVHGHCYTGALEVVLGCDLIVATESARFADTHGKFSLTPTWGMSQRLPRRIGAGAARMLMFTGQPVSGIEAAKLGLVDLCVPDEALRDRTVELAQTIVANSWHTLRADKLLVNRGQHLGLGEGLRYERENSPGRGPDMEERLQRFASKS
jgi:enoyl-CoA hydratase